MIHRYDWAGGSEAMLRFGPAEGPVVVAALPLLEEANRTRAFVMAVLRKLADRGIAGALPDLPGTAESLVGTGDATLANWRAAYAGAVASLARPGFGFAIRGGALLDTAAPLTGRWHLAPMTGAEAVRELVRIHQAAARESGGEAFDAATLTDATLPPVEIAGNRLSRGLLADLQPAEPASGARVVRLETDARAADLKLPGTPLWRRAEPDNDLALADRIADDIADWVRPHA